MEKIIKVALEGKFGADAVQSIIEIVNATPNPIMATEILLNVYTPIVLLPQITSGKQVRTLVSSDEWTNSVTYTYEEEVVKSLYLANDCDTSLVTIDNYKEFEVGYNSNGNYKYFHLPTGEIKTRQNSCGIDEWLSYESKQEMVTGDM